MPFCPTNNFRRNKTDILPMINYLKLSDHLPRGCIFDMKNSGGLNKIDQKNNDLTNYI